MAIRYGENVTPRGALPSSGFNPARNSQHGASLIYKRYQTQISSWPKQSWTSNPLIVDKWNLFIVLWARPGGVGWVGFLSSLRKYRLLNCFLHLWSSMSLPRWNWDRSHGLPALSCVWQHVKLSDVSLGTRPRYSQVVDEEVKKSKNPQWNVGLHEVLVNKPMVFFCRFSLSAVIPDGWGSRWCMLT